MISPTLLPKAKKKKKRKKKEIYLYGKQKYPFLEREVWKINLKFANILE